MTETIKRTVQPYFVCEGNVAAFLAAKDHVNVFVYDGGIVPDPHGLITAGHENKTARTIGFHEGDDVPEERPAGVLPAPRGRQPGRRLAEAEGPPARVSRLRRAESRDLVNPQAGLRR